MIKQTLREILKDLAYDSQGRLPTAKHEMILAAEAAIRQYYLDLLDAIGNEAMPRIGHSGKYVRSPQSFQDGFEEARAELRKKIIGGSDG